MHCVERFARWEEGLWGAQGQPGGMSGSDLAWGPGKEGEKFPQSQRPLCAALTVMLVHKGVQRSDVAFQARGKSPAHLPNPYLLV